jgi:hypothetical protein
MEDEIEFFDETEDLTLEDILDNGDTEEEDIVLSFIDDVDFTDYGFAEKAVDESLSQYSPEEIIDFNEMDDREILTNLFYNGVIGLPITLEDEEAQEEQDLPDQED